ncbi:MAG TPA: hypothetical protein VKE40_27575, partial [Gemmataceae bacterium]|nr:hypothetical protein [Gemmataceae bacterium]
MPMIASRLEARKSRKSRRLAFDRLEDRTVPVTGLVVSVTPDVVSESVGSVTGRVTRVDTSLALPLTVRLTSADPARVTVPDTVVIPAGESMATFPVGVIDDTIPGNSASIIVSAAGAVTTTLAVDGSFGYPPGSGRMIFSTVGGQTRSITQAPDGKIVVVGSSNNSSSPPTIRVARYLANGLLDTTGFRRTGSGGILTGVFDIELTPFSDQAQAVAVQPDRKILIAGNVVGVSGPSPYNLFITRLNEDGSTDPSFGTGGLVTLNTTPGFTSVWDMALLADGKFLVTGSGGTSLKLARFNADGSLDTTYGVGGFASAPMSDNGSAYTVAMQADGKAVVAGQTNGGDPKPGLARFNTDGTLDTSFGSGGVVIDDIPGGREGIYDLTIQPDGKLLAAGWFGPYVPPAGDNYNSFILRYNPDGTRDTSFDDDGLVLEDLGDPDYFSGVGVLPDGRIIASGSAFTVTPAASIRTNVVRYLPNGQRDDRATTT